MEILVACIFIVSMIVILIFTFRVGKHNNILIAENDKLKEKIKELEKAPKREDSYDLKEFLHDQLTYNTSMIEIKVVDPKTIYKRSVRDV